MDKTEFVNISQARAFLASYLDAEPSEVALIGEGAWSRCFGFRRGDDELAIRFGNYVDDFRKDQLASAYATPDLPIPEVLDVGQAFDGYYAISRRAHGVPLESLQLTQWLAIVPSVVSAWKPCARPICLPLQGSAVGEQTVKRPCQLVRPSVGSWGRHTGPTHLRLARTAVGFDPKAMRRSPGASSLLERVASDAIPRCLVHCDLINRNVLVLVGDDRISAVFDWGCSLYGDHLYDLAWFEFWAPWLPQLDMQLPEIGT